MKYALVTKHIWKDLLGDQLIKQGLYQWRQIFKGDVLDFNQVTKDQLEQYDIVHVNLCTNDVPVAITLGSVLKNTSVKLIVNVDYAVEMWDRMFTNVRQFLYALKSADFIFAVEPLQKQVLELLMGTPIDLIPHPVDTKRLKEWCLPKDKRYDFILTMYHRYDMQKLVPSMISRVAKTLQPIAVGVADEPLPKELYIMSGGMLAYYDYLRLLRICKIGVEYYSVHSHGRFASECACLKVPLVSTNFSYNSVKFYPYTTKSPSDISSMALTIKRLYEDEAFYDKVIHTAYKRVEEHNWENSKKRLLSRLEDIKKGLSILF